MPTTDIVSGGNGFAGGGVGDGQRVTVTGSITSGASPVFTPSTDIFAANGGDPTGKTIYLVYSSTSYPTNNTPPTITAYNAGTGAVTLSGTNSTSASSVSFDVLWGTSNSSVLSAFNTWAIAQVGQVVLTFPAGRFCINANPFLMPNRNIADVKWVGAGAGSTILSQMVPSELRLGGDIPVLQKGLTSGGNSARLQTASAGATSVTLVDPTTYGSKITVGRYCLIGGFDMQGAASGLFGYPPNLYFYEWNKITAYDSGTGVVSLLNPLSQAYKSTWPRWTGDDAFHADLGGPATIWVAGADYDSTVELNDLTLDSPYHQNAILCRDVILRRVTHIGPGTYPTQCNNFTADNCVYTQTLEIDKIVNNVSFTDCTLGNMFFQSASPNTLTITGGTMEQSSGTPKRFTYSGVAFTGTAKLQVGASAYGVTSYGNVQDCSGIVSFPQGGANSVDVGTASSFYSFNAGVMRFLKSDNDGVAQENPTRFLVPGAWVRFDNNKYIDQVTDVYEDGTYCYIQWRNTTDWPFTPVSYLASHPCPDFTMRNCTGTAYELEDWNQAPARRPLWSYSKRTYVAGASAATALPIAQRVTVWGKPTSITSTVSSLFTGGTALTFNLTQFSNGAFVKQSDYSTVSNFAETINMKIAGARVMANAVAGSGAQSGDTLYDFTSAGNVWFFGAFNSSPVFSANVTNGDTPTITVEWIMDQGIPAAVPTAVAPLRLRLKA